MSVVGVNIYWKLSIYFKTLLIQVPYYAAFPIPLPLRLHQELMVTTGWYVRVFVSFPGQQLGARRCFCEMLLPGEEQPAECICGWAPTCCWTQGSWQDGGHSHLPSHAPHVGTPVPSWYLTDAVSCVGLGSVGLSALLGIPNLFLIHIT